MNLYGRLSLAVRDTTVKLSQHLQASPCFNRIQIREISRESEDVVLAQDVGDKGVLTFNRPKVLNAMNLTMMEKSYETLLKWEKEKTMVITKGAGGKAYCAGGDVRTMAIASKNGEDYAKAAFRQDYLLNFLIATYCIPYVALIDGITMGAGMGVSVHGHYRVATEKTVCAMPETAIGLFPDVGASYFLPRLKGKLGVYLALTGHRLKGIDNFFAGFATHYCLSAELPKIEKELLASKNPKDILKFYEKPPARLKFSLEPLLKKIDDIFSAPSVEEIVQRLEKDKTDWSMETLATLKKCSPLSSKITLKHLQHGAQLSLKECIQMEYRLAYRCSEGHDFIEGVRALLVDKDQNPKWSPPTLEEVSQKMVDDFFAPLETDQELEVSA